jgi:DNA-binding winged helix-turn-helix (wHTH) protein
LVEVVRNAFEKAEFSENYIVEVLQCSDHEVAYSYQIKNESEKNIIPCSGRYLPENCYQIEVLFTSIKADYFNRNTLLFIGVIFLLGFLFISFYARKSIEKNVEINSEFIALGSFEFYPKENKLQKATTEINLSKKECELLEIFVANPNQIVKREELTKKVWEDNGVFVGRSLDTYISKLRKKLKGDASIQLINIHGVGYKLEIK